MLNMVKQFFGKNRSEADRATEGDVHHDLTVATCALFVEMAKIDESFSDVEMETIIGVLKEKYGLSKEHADALIAEADQKLDESVDLWQFAKLINENYSIQEKKEIIEILWHIVFVDGKMDAHEDYLMHKLGKLLRLSHTELMEAKVKVLHSK